MKHLAPYDLALTLSAARARQKDRLRETAWIVATVINTMSTAKVTVDELLGDAPPAPTSIDAAVEQAAAARDAAALAEADGWADAVDAEFHFDDADVVFDEEATP